MMKNHEKKVLPNMNCVIKKYTNTEFNRVFNIHFVFKKEENDKLKSQRALHRNYLLKNVFVYSTQFIDGRPTALNQTPSLNLG